MYRAFAPGLALPVLAVLALTAGCDGGSQGFAPTPGVSGRILLEEQPDHSGALVRLIPIDSVTVTDSAGYFSFAEIPDGRWLVEAKYPYFETDTLAVDVQGGLQRNSVRRTLKQSARFWVELSDTIVCLCECETGSELELEGFVKNLTDRDLVFATPSTPMADFAIIPESAGPGGIAALIGGNAPSANRRTQDCAIMHERLGPNEDPCEGYGLLLSGEMDFPGYVVLSPGEERRFTQRAWLLAQCFEPGRYEVFWALTNGSFYPKHFEYVWADLNRTLLKKRRLITPASIRFIASGAG